MSLIFNPGSENKGGNYEQAVINANKWLKSIHDEGFPEVKMEFVEQTNNGNFLFNFIHQVTNNIVCLEIHGFTDEECKKFMFWPRVYWNGSSTADPKIEDWLNDKFGYKIVFFKKD